MISDVLPLADKSLRQYAKSQNSDDDDEEDITVDDDDWRAFRAKLVMGEKVRAKMMVSLRMSNLLVLIAKAVSPRALEEWTTNRI